MLAHGSLEWDGIGKQELRDIIEAIGKVGQEIEDVKEEIKGVEESIAVVKERDELDYLRKKEGQLRKNLEQLRDKELILMEEKRSLRTGRRKVLGKLDAALMNPFGPLSSIWVGRGPSLYPPLTSCVPLYR